MNLQKYVQDHGDVRLYCKQKYRDIEIRTWDKWKLYSECSEEERDKANLIEMFKDMILLDIDNEEEYPKILSQLLKEKVTFSVYRTNRGYHVHLFYPELKDKSDKDIKLIREYYIKKFGTCESKVSGVFARPGYPHFKSGNKVRYIMSISNGINHLDIEALDYVKKKQPNNINPRHGGERKSNGCLLSEYSLKNKLRPNTRRGEVLAKNLAILYTNQYGRDKARELMRSFEIMQNTRGTEWISWVISNNRREFACGEIRNWLRKTQSVDVEELCCWRCIHGRSQ